MPEVSIIVVSFNGLQETTKPCLESIFENSAGLDYEVIVVDNASSDQTCAYLQEMAATQPRLRWIANSTNLGFAAANNIGMKAAKGECLILLNSDTLVTPGSLARLVDFVKGKPDVGMAGPVTNSAGNEQMIFTDASTVTGIISQGQQWTNASEGDRFETMRLGFFCVAIRRELVSRIGGLDEDFGLGFYEDDDYCLRSLKEGLRLVCLEDVFVYHRGSYCFQRQPSEETKALMKRNRGLLEAKHHLTYRPLRTWKRYLELAEIYLWQANEHPSDRLLSKIKNRLRMAAACSPKSALKRIQFHVRYRALKRRIEQLPKSTGQEAERISPPDAPWMHEICSSQSGYTRPNRRSPVPMTKELDANEYDTDKSKMPHYLRNYEEWFTPLWDQPIVLLELGVHRGGSLLLWRDYFPKGKIVGLDLNEVKVDDATGRIRVYQGGQEDAKLLDRIADENAPSGFDIIIDDASHIGDLTRASFWHLFEKHLRPGGLYVIEDWGTGYWESWPDGSFYDPPTNSAPIALEEGLFSKAFGRRKSKFRKTLPSHMGGMVGFVKQLVDECGMGDVTFPGWGKGTPTQSRIQRMEISHGQVMVQKKFRA